MLSERGPLLPARVEAPLLAEFLSGRGPSTRAPNPDALAQDDTHKRQKVTPRANSQKLRAASRQPQLPRNPLHRLDTEADVLIQVHAQLLRALDDVFAADAAGEGFVLHLFSD